MRIAFFIGISMNLNKKIIKSLLILIFSISSQGLLAQTWIEVEMHFPPGDSIEIKFSDLTTFTNQDTGWLSTAWIEKEESDEYYFMRKIYRTEDGGNNWIEKFINKQKLVVEYAKVFSIYSWEPDYFIAMYNDSVAGALISEDGGETWINRSITDEHLLNSISKIHFFDELNGIAFNEHRWFTSDGGYTWEQSDDTFENITPTDVCFVNDSLGWMVSGGNQYATDSGYLANTIDGGKTWQYQDSFTVILSGVDFIDSLKGFTVGTDFRFSMAFIYSTIDGGVSWDIEQLYGEDSYKDIGFLDEKHGWILARGGKILRTNDGGENWEVQLDNLDCRFGELIILKKEKVAYIFGYKDNKDLVLYRSDLSNITGLKGDDEIIDKAMYLYPNFPNPFNPMTTIRYDLPSAATVKLQIFDLTGRLIQTLVDENKPAGHYAAVWNARNFSSGIYFFRIQAGDFTAVKKCVKLK